VKRDDPIGKDHAIGDDSGTRQAGYVYVAFENEPAREGDHLTPSLVSML
jgi:hypothetical protein